MVRGSTRSARRSRSRPVSGSPISARPGGGDRPGWRSRSGSGILAVSVALSPAAWQQFIDITLTRGPLDQTGFVAVPYAIRFAAGLVLALAAGRLRPQIGEPLLVIAVTLALPTLWFTALATLVALYPVIRTGRVRAP